MSPAMVASRALVLECGENATLASMLAQPRGVHSAETVAPNPFASPCCQKLSNAERNGASAFFPRSTTALFACTKSPRQLKLVEPQTTVCCFGPSTTMVLLC